MGRRAPLLQALTAEVCAGTAAGLLVKAVAGSAVLFRPTTDAHSGSGGGGELETDWQLWHSGCAVLEGQKVRCDASRRRQYMWEM